MRIGLLTLTIAIVALSTSGCSSFRGWMGASKAAPDEFRVVTRAPLSMPPDYGLVAPQPGAPRPQETDARQSARQIVVDRQGGLVNPAAEVGRVTRAAGVMYLLDAPETMVTVNPSPECFEFFVVGASAGRSQFCFGGTNSVTKLVRRA